MRNSRHIIALTFLLAVTTLALPVAARQQSYRLTDQQALQLVNRTTRDAELFRRSVDQAISRSPVDQSRLEDNIDQFMAELVETTAHLRDHLDRRLVIATDVEEVLGRASRVDAFMRRNRLGAQVEASWATVRRDLDELARAYNVNWDWATPRFPPTAPAAPLYHRLTGTYQLDHTRSEDARRAADQATRTLPTGQRQRVFDNLVNRLDAPETLTIDRVENTVTIASSRAPRVTFDVDGRPRSEQSTNGRMTTTRATLYGDQLSVSTTGNRGNDFTATFEPIDNGRTLRVTRRLDTDGLAQPLTVQSFYRRTSEVPQWDLYNNVDANPFIVPDGTVMVATLNTMLSTRTSGQGDRFSLVVNSPARYQGAVIEGVVSRVNDSNRPGTRANMFFNFDSIRMRNGQRSEFTGILDSVRLPDGTVISVNNEGNVRNSSSTDDAVQRGAIGGAIGAIIGALAGGGKGAAIGAVAGAGVGAGSVYIEGRDRLDLPPGTEITITATAPRNRRPQ